MKSESLRKQPGWKQFLNNFFIFLLVFVLLKGVIFLLEDRCSIITCEPVAWNEIQKIAIDNMKTWNDEYKLDEKPLFIFETNESGLQKSDLLKNIEIRISYVSTKQTGSQNGPIYSTREIWFDDQNLWIKSRWASLRSSQPSGEIFNRFKRVSVDYREALEITWDRADSILHLPIRSVLLLLSLDEKTYDDYGVESVWYIIYYDKNEHISYWIDAQSGKIVHNK